MVESNRTEQLFEHFNQQISQITLTFTQQFRQTLTVIMQCGENDDLENASVELEKEGGHDGMNVSEEGDHAVSLEKSEDPIHPDCDQITDNKVKSVSKIDFLSPLTQTTSLVGDSLQIIKRRLNIANEVFDKSPQRREHMVALNRDPPDDYGPIVHEDYGGVEVLKLDSNVPVSQVNDDQVLVKVVAVALNPADFERRLGKFKATDSPLPIVPGYGVTGVAGSVGNDPPSEFYRAKPRRIFATMLVVNCYLPDTGELNSDHREPVVTSLANNQSGLHVMQYCLTHLYDKDDMLLLDNITYNCSVEHIFISGEPEAFIMKLLFGDGIHDKMLNIVGTIQGLIGLAAIHAKYLETSTRFSKWRVVLKIGSNKSSQLFINKNANGLSRYVIICQENDLVPIVELEILMNGPPDITLLLKIVTTTGFPFVVKDMKFFTWDKQIGKYGAAVFVIMLLKEAVSSYGSHSKEQKISIPQLVDSVQDTGTALKKTPKTNITAIGRAMTQVAVTWKDVLREMKVAQFAIGVVSDMLIVVKELILSITSLLKKKDPNSSSDSVNSVEKLLKLCQGIGVQIDELGACLYPPQEFPAIKVASKKISSMVDEMQAEMDQLNGSSEAFLQACTGLRTSLRQLGSEPYCSFGTDLLPKIENLVLKYIALLVLLENLVIQNVPYYLRLQGVWGMFVRGVLHWVTIKTPELDSYLLIVAFDLGVGKHRELPLPDFLVEILNMAVRVLGGGIPILVNYSHDRMDVWVMNEYGVTNYWTKLFSVKQPNVIRLFNCVRPLASSKSVCLFGATKLDQSSKGFKSTKGESHPSVASVFVPLANLYNKIGKFRESKAYCENELCFYLKPGIPQKEIATGLIEVSAIYEYINELDQSLNSLHKALKVYDGKVGQQSTMIGIEAQIGVLCYMMESYSDSYNSFKSAISKFQAIGEKKSALFAIALNQMELACVQLYAINEAADLFEEKNLVRANIGDSRAFIIIRRNL